MEYSATKITRKANRTIKAAVRRLIYVVIALSLRNIHIIVFWRQLMENIVY